MKGGAEMEGEGERVAVRCARLGWRKHDGPVGPWRDGFGSKTSQAAG